MKNVWIRLSDLIIVFYNRDVYKSGLGVEQLKQIKEEKAI